MRRKVSPVASVHLRVHETASEPGHGRIQRFGAPITLDRGFEAAQLHQNLGAVEMGFGEIGIGCHCPRPCRFGFDDAPHRDQRLGQVVVCFGERRRVLRCCRTVANRFLGTTAFQQQQATVGERDGTVRILFDGVRETLSGGGVVTLCLVDEAQIIERHRLRRVAPERARNLNGRLRQLPALVVADPQIVPRGGMLRRMSEQFAIQALGVIDLSGLMQRHCTLEVCVRWQK